MKKQKYELKKALGVLDVFCLASGAMISSGIFILPGLAYNLTGPSVIVSYFVGSLLAMTGMFSIIELSTAMPRSGGDYFFISRSMGPGVGTVSSLMSWFSLSLKSTFALVGMAAFITPFLYVNIHLVALALCLVFVYLNYIGVKEASRFGVVLAIGLLALMLMFVVTGLGKVSASNYEPFFANRLRGMFATAGFIFVSFGGLLKIASLSEEIKNPHRTIPLGLSLALGVVSLLYSAIVFVTVGVSDAAQLSKTLTPISDAARVFLGSFGFYALSIAAILAFITTANAGLMAASRYPLALARDKMIPPVFGKISKKHKTPYIAIFATGLVMAIYIFLKLEFLIKTASVVLILTYVLAHLSIFILRESKLQNYRPSFKVPLYPWLQIASLLGFVFILYEMGAPTLFFALFIIAIGLSVYLIYGRRQVKTEYALMHIVERITSRELTSDGLESELREIIRERDDIVIDRFDKMVEDAHVLDIKQKMSYQELFQLVADKLSAELNLSSKDIYEKLMKRELDTTTVLTPEFAIPHIVLDAEDRFSILMARNREGFSFPNNEDSVKMVFFIAGSKNERTFHLQAISALAQLIHNRHFISQWMKAKDENALKDVILLGKRQRHN